MWVSVFGNPAPDLVINDDSEFDQTALDYLERVFYLLLEQYPTPMVVTAIASLIGLLLCIASADSMALVIGNFTSKIANTRQDGKKWTRVFWVIAIGVLTVSMLYVSSIPTL